MEVNKILYVEDDETLGFLTKEAMEDDGYMVQLFENGLDAQQAFKKEAFDICILDVMLPKKDGFELAKYIRTQNAHIPIIFVTAKSLTADKIAGFEIGGDDYLVKPYEMAELLMKIKVFIRRKVIVEPPSDIIKIGQLHFEYGNLQITHANGTKSLTQREADLLFLLYTHRNQLVKRETILEKLWGRNDYFLGRSMDVFISRLRKLLKYDPQIELENIHGVGFIMKI